MPDLQQAIAAIKAGDKATGKQLLIEIINADPGNESAWLWMTQCVNKDIERFRCLQNALRINPHNEQAKRGAAILQQKLFSQQPTKVEAPPEPIESTPEPIKSADPTQVKDQAPPLPHRPLKKLKRKAPEKKQDSTVTWLIVIVVIVLICICAIISSSSKIGNKSTSQTPAPTSITAPTSTRVIIAPRSTIAPATHPPGATAKCNDGEYSYSANRRGTCSHHGGVAVWY